MDEGVNREHERWLWSIECCSVSIPIHYSPPINKCPGSFIKEDTLLWMNRVTIWQGPRLIPLLGGMALQWKGPRDMRKDSSIQKGSRRMQRNLIQETCFPPRHLLRTSWTTSWPLSPPDSIDSNAADGPHLPILIVNFSSTRSFRSSILTRTHTRTQINSWMKF